MANLNLNRRGAPSSGCQASTFANMNSKMLGVICGILITPPAIFLAILSGGAGHGDYILARILYPYSCWSMSLSEQVKVPGMIGLACIQLPLYGWLIGVAFERPRNPMFALFAGCLHIIASAFMFR